ncbi:MAG: hypothetical protein LBH81_03205 [Rickettsiales bacterium]|jgi:hypothetical protein|nr:hypothetical protein [Rickettsiales bacterium]
MDKNEKSVPVILHKTARSAPSFTEVLGHLSEAEAETFVKEFSNPLAGRCISRFQIQVNYEHIIPSDGAPYKVLLNVKILEIPGHAFMCHTGPEKDIREANSDAYERIKYCYGQLAAGKCKCKTMAEIVGKRFYPELYKSR